MNCETRWYELAHEYSQNEDLIAKCFLDIQDKYSSPDRHYHTLDHIYDLLLLSEKYADQLQNRSVVDFAIFYHDIIYNPYMHSNELESAAYARKKLAALSVPGNEIEQVEFFIYSTEIHKLLPFPFVHVEDVKLFLDFDMAILGAPTERYIEYLRQVRREYGVLPETVYNAGRKQFLIKTLDSPIYLTYTFRSTLESQARANIEMELQMLS